ncbi:MAG: hypothetical protein AAGE65_15220 [Planctomycetota bacterium]
MNRSSNRLRPRRRGVAMIETVLTLPFIFVLLALIMYCGVSMLRWHRVSTVDRYEAWRATAYAPGPHAPAAGGGVFDASDLGDAFFPVTVSGSGGNARTRDPFGLEQLTVSVRRGLATGGNQDPALTYLQNAVDREAGSTSAGALFGFLFNNETRPLPTTRRVEIAGAFTDRFSQSFAGEIDHSVSRLDGDWRYVNDALDMRAETFYDRRDDLTDVPLYNDDRGDERPRRIVSPGTGVRLQTFTNFDSALGRLPAVNPLAGELQDMSLRVPAYVGPKLPFRAQRREDLSWDFEWAPAGE